MANNPDINQFTNTFTEIANSYVDYLNAKDDRPKLFEIKQELIARVKTELGLDNLNDEQKNVIEEFIKRLLDANKKLENDFVQKKKKENADAQSIKQKEEADNQNQKEIKSLRDLHARRMAHKGSPKAQEQSWSAKVSHLTGIREESLIGEFLADAFIHLFMLVSGAQYMQDAARFEQAKLSGTAFVCQDKRKYKNVNNGEEYNGFQPIYPIDGNGKPDFSQQPVLDGNVPAEVIIANGYVPPANVLRSSRTVWDSYLESTLGRDKLDMNALLRVHGCIPGANNGQNDGNDPALTLRAQPKRL